MFVCYSPAVRFRATACRPRSARAGYDWRGLALYAGLLLCLRPSFSQPLAEISQQYLRTTWTTENGLPQNTITAICQTPDGYLWLGTFGGLARFDGVKFTVFNTTNAPAGVNRGPSPGQPSHWGLTT